MTARKISIVIPTFNREKTLPFTLDSILAQTDPNWECILVDDGSTDGTFALIEQVSASDNRFQAMRRGKDRSKGANACRNLGAEAANTDDLMFLDSDDMLTEDCIERRRAALSNHPETDLLVFTTALRKEKDHSERIFNRDPKVPSRLNYLAIFATDQVPWCISSSLWKRSYFLHIGGFNEDLLRHQDAELHTRALLDEVRFKRVFGAADNIYIFGDEHSDRGHEWMCFRFKQTMRYLQMLGDRFEAAGLVHSLKQDWRYYFFRIHKDTFSYNPGVFDSEELVFKQLLRRHNILSPMDRLRFFAIKWVTRMGMLLRFNPRPWVARLSRPYERRFQEITQGAG